MFCVVDFATQTGVCRLAVVGPRRVHHENIEESRGFGYLLDPHACVSLTLSTAYLRDRFDPVADAALRLRRLAREELRLRRFPLADAEGAQPWSLVTRFHIGTAWLRLLSAAARPSVLRCRLQELAHERQRVDANGPRVVNRLLREPLAFRKHFGGARHVGDALRALRIARFGEQRARAIDFGNHQVRGHDASSTAGGNAG